jgi:hypothetical protein
MFQQQEGANAGIERLRQFTGDDSLLLAIGRGVALALGLLENAEY